MGPEVLRPATSDMAEIDSREADATFVVVPAFNEAPVVGETVQKLVRLGVHVVVVDDCSTDGTSERLVGLPVNVLRHTVNLGQGAATQTGIDFALQKGARYLVTFDADGQHQPEDVGKVLRRLIDERRDVVLGSRFLGSAPGMSGTRQALLRLAVLHSRWTTGLRLTDAHNGLRAFRAEVWRPIRITQNRMAHASEILQNIARAKLSYAEVPVTLRYTDYSKAKGQKGLGAVDILFELTIRRLLG